MQARYQLRVINQALEEQREINTRLEQKVDELLAAQAED
jgi:hypothetical protein